ncbi:MAG: hypothetical protein MUC80_09660, partial [Candidatus Thermoplasmatota archaeon]|nr:hypothetical protein [Candidatus Thermoplasmatota archaeon]
MIRNILLFKYLIIIKKCFSNKIFSIGIISLFIISSLSAAYPQPQMKTPDINPNQQEIFNNDVDQQKMIPSNIKYNQSLVNNIFRDTTYLSIVPTSQTVGFSETFSIIGHLDPGEPIIGVQIDLSFNASLIQVVSVAKADPIWFFFPPVINNTAGEIHGAAVVVFGYNISTPINCFQITFISLTTEGTSPLILHNVIVTNQNAQQISPVINNGEVIVEGPINFPPVFGASSPANNSVNQPLSLTWSIPINDPEGNL